MKSRTLFFTAPRRVEVREMVLPPLKDSEVLVETTCSAISAGTEMLVYRGEFPRVLDSHDSLSSGLTYPLEYGYASVGRIREVGTHVDKSLRDRLVFGFAPHASAFICNPSSLLFAPDTFPPEACSFLPNVETAVNLVQDGAPILGERVLVIGQGVVGLLVTALLKEFPLESLVTSDCYELRRKASLEGGADQSWDPDELRVTLADPSIHQRAYTQNFDLTFELSGSPSALNDAIALTSFSGRIVIGSWYGEKQSPIALGGAFHRSRIQLISSQVSTIAPALSGRWDKRRRFGVAWEALGRIQPQKWITHRCPIEEAELAYRLLDENPQETIQVILNYP